MDSSLLFYKSKERKRSVENLNLKRKIFPKLLQDITFEN